MAEKMHGDFHRNFSAERDVGGITATLADIIAEIATASGEQSAGIQSVTLAVAKIGETTQQNGALVEESSAAAISLEEQSHQLSRLIALFTTS